MQENITFSGKRGGSLDGNATRKLLCVIDSLANHLSQHSEESFRLGEPFLQTLKALQIVVSSTFSNTLKENWETSIVDFSVLYLSLKTKRNKPVSVTPKVRIFLFILLDQLLFYFFILSLWGPYSYATCSGVPEEESRGFKRLTTPKNNYYILYISVTKLFT